MKAPSSRNFIIPIFPCFKLLLKKSGRKLIRIAKFGNGKKSADDTIGSRRDCWGSFYVFYRFSFLFVNPRKLLYSSNFLLNLDPHMQ